MKRGKWCSFLYDINIRKRRQSLDIIADILKIATEKASKTTIIYKVNLNFNRANKYLNLLLSKGLLTKEGLINTRYITTTKGIQFLKHYEEIKKIETELLNEFQKLQVYFGLNPSINLRNLMLK